MLTGAPERGFWDALQFETRTNGPSFGAAKGWGYRALRRAACDFQLSHALDPSNAVILSRTGFPAECSLLAGWLSEGSLYLGPPHLTNPTVPSTSASSAP